jgi:hypothetical protein
LSGTFGSVPEQKSTETETRQASRAKTTRSSPRARAKPKPKLAQTAQVRQTRVAAPGPNATQATSPDRKLLLAGGLLLFAFVLGDAVLLVSARLALSGRDDE